MVWRVADYARGAANTGPAWADAAAEVLAILEPDEIVAFGACAAALAAALDTPAVRAAARPLVAANDEADFAAFRLWVVGRGREFYDAVRGAWGCPSRRVGRVRPVRGRLAIGRPRRVSCQDRAARARHGDQGVTQLVVVVKPFRAEAVLRAVAAAGVHACVVREAKGYGRQKGYLELYVGSDYSGAFLPKVEITVYVESSRAAEVADAVARAARTGRIGDGKVFSSKGWHEAIEF